jgi:hypothetical protein
METLKLDLLGAEPDVEFDDSDSESEVKPLDLVMPVSEEGGLNEYECNARVLMVSFCTYMAVWTAVVLVFVLTMAAGNNDDSDATDKPDGGSGGSGSGT